MSEHMTQMVRIWGNTCRARDAKLARIEQIGWDNAPEQLLRELEAQADAADAYAEFCHFRHFRP